MYRFFEGTPADASQALDKLKKLPNETKVSFGQVNTKAVLVFEVVVEFLSRLVLKLSSDWHFQ